ncbi:platelet-activating factor receptor-like [Oreochromis niloticus]|uniref:Platelet-activating factor receptor n=1 Tax=Oreochromis niloticus TaxID=8128 RepID=I3KZY6_ORENI|nr:platelet-activating factor receptor-like [Oreochromis niloticus]XP_019204783.1 platelet-activating factor receptor-like [Oreochromis niloticus]XP_019204784.1 platelet-activating factor receptor-like [Oreochromis niloticus]XP_019204785.1 platelet-activating factor receptor-like [Oreochromis niloticus]XP_019204786.1 platelet-activating factor receptor-like [Oreochromis niloticus]
MEIIQSVTMTTMSSVESTTINLFLDSEFRYVLIPVSYIIFFILGLISNLYVLFVLRCLHQAKAMGEIHIYMTNLTIADLLFVCALPFWIDYYMREGDWVYGDFMCRVTGTFFFINTYGTILFLAAISINRYWAVTRPLDAASSDHRIRGIIVCICIWAFIVAMSVPFLVSPGINVHRKNNTDIRRCFEGYQGGTNDKKKKVVVTHFLIIGLFFVVFLLIVMCNILIARSLIFKNSPQSESQSSGTQSKKPNLTSTFKRPTGVKRRALQMLLAVVGVFVLCFLPHHVVQGPWVLAVLEIEDGFGHVNYNETTRQLLSDAHQITLVLMGLNCILDPVVYYFATGKFRGLIKARIKKLIPCTQTQSYHLNQPASPVWTLGGNQRPHIKATKAGRQDQTPHTERSSVVIA